MSPDSPTAPVLEPEIPAPRPPVHPGLLELFLAFAKMSLAGFGGVLVWARRGIVEQHRWMTAEEFNQTFALCPLASQLANAANGFSLFAGALLRRLLVVVPHLHFAEDTFALHLLLESAERLIDVVIAD